MWELEFVTQFQVEVLFSLMRTVFLIIYILGVRGGKSCTYPAAARFQLHARDKRNPYPVLRGKTRGKRYEGMSVVCGYMYNQYTLKLHR